MFEREWPFTLRAHHRDMATARRLVIPDAASVHMASRDFRKTLDESTKRSTMATRAGSSHSTSASRWHEHLHLVSCALFDIDALRHEARCWLLTNR